MKTIKQQLKEKYHLSNYQIAQLTFLVKTLLSEVSKTLIMAVIFYHQLPLYFFALLIMIILRCSTGGMHFYTYASCLTTSILFLLFGIVLLPNIEIQLGFKLILLLLSLFSCYYVGPIPSKYRPSYSIQFKKRCKRISSFFIFFYTIILYIMPESQFLIVGFWIIILHSMQLIIAKIIRKEVQ